MPRWPKKETETEEAPTADVEGASGEIDLTDGVSAAEASLAGQTLAARKEPKSLHLVGWVVQAERWFKDGNIRLASGRVEWQVDDTDTVTLGELAQLEASLPGNWKQIRRVHES